MPSDVRKVSDLPKAHDRIGLRPAPGHSPRTIA